MDLQYLLEKFPKVKAELKNKMGKNFIDLIDVNGKITNY